MQVTGPKWLAAIARGYCTVMRGTPLLIQLYLFYYGIGSILATVPELRQSFLWRSFVRAISTRCSPSP